MAPRRPNEDEEWLDARIESWVETYKKSMLTPAILALIAEHQPAGIATITDALTQRTGWQITERGLYRNVKRLQDSGFIANTDVNAPRTGAKRKELSLTKIGKEFLAGITENFIELPDK
ncbi:PadR family transcriptional regulator [Brevibacterium aurantiacum]|uniref:PadR family transcriptional regulator n=1 Tax=Brevibacterium aurantiacum TaxID=273384 RepID=UPI001869163D|nr:helix-turn-helix transcriptional regulator [Brevibacterium aurantiacum]